MNDVLIKTIERILAGDLSLSRNRNFEAFETPDMKRALRTVKLIRSVRADLLAHDDSGTITATTTADGHTELTMVFEGGSRTVYLTAVELRLIGLDDAVRAVLGRHSVP